jgi:hypothetical protein
MGTQGSVRGMGRVGFPATPCVGVQRPSQTTAQAATTVTRRARAKVTGRGPRTVLLLRDAEALASGRQREVDDDPAGF